MQFPTRITPLILLSCLFQASCETPVSAGAEHTKNDAQTDEDSAPQPGSGVARGMELFQNDLDYFGGIYDAVMSDLFVSVSAELNEVAKGRDAKLVCFPDHHLPPLSGERARVAAYGVAIPTQVLGDNLSQGNMNVVAIGSRGDFNATTAQIQRRRTDDLQFWTRDSPVVLNNCGGDSTRYCNGRTQSSRFEVVARRLEGEGEAAYYAELDHDLAPERNNDLPFWTSCYSLNIWEQFMEDSSTEEEGPPSFTFVN